MKTACMICLTMIVGSHLPFQPVAASPATTTTQAVDLSGVWRFELDPEDRGVLDQWWQRTLDQKIDLPGSTDLAGYGEVEETQLGRWTRSHRYQGRAWYQRDIVIPEEWDEMAVELFLERCHWQTEIWLDDQKIGSQDSLCTPHQYNLGVLSPGTHRLTVAVDNRMIVGIGEWSSARTDESQTNWNGIIGEISLRPLAPVAIRTIRVDTNLSSKQALLGVELLNHSEQPAKVTLAFELADASPEAKPLANQRYSAEIPAGTTLLQYSLDLPAPLMLWDEFNPNLYTLHTALWPEQGGQAIGYHQTVFGVRSLDTDASHLRLNGNKVFLRGVVDAAQNPETGFPAMDQAWWDKVFSTIKDYGFNHVRFHSNCPPEAAFAAADELGLYLEIALPLWVGDGQISAVDGLLEFMRDESRRIIDAYGNHPSFCLMSMGNELGRADDPGLHEMVRYLQKQDQRRLYTCSNLPVGPTSRPDDYFVDAITEHGWLRGQNHLGNQGPDTEFDYRQVIEKLDRPTIAHEVGQYAMYVNFDELKKYQGPVRPAYLEVYRDVMAQQGILDRAEDFRRASGALLVQFYRAEIEAALRTPNQAGFQCLGATDFHGWGTAIIGWLDPFWDSKGLITPEQFRQFNAPEVLLARLPQRVYTAGEVLTATCELAHYGPASLPPSLLQWRLLSDSGETLQRGQWDLPSLATGQLHSLGVLQTELADLPVPSELTLELSLPEFGLKNSWRVWLCAEEVHEQANLLVTEKWDDHAREALSNGKNVLLVAHQPAAYLEAASFRPVLWSYRLFQRRDGYGLWIDHQHPALAEFPTRFHADWQWQDLVKSGMCINYRQILGQISPIVESIDCFDLARPQTMLFETRVGSGRLLVCGMDVLTDLDKRPAARQLLNSLVKYAASQQFEPPRQTTLEQLNILFDAPEIQSAVQLPESLVAQPKFLEVLAAEQALPLVCPPWNSSVDKVSVQVDGYHYRVEGYVEKTGENTYWVGPDLGWEITVPPGSGVVVCLHFVDHDNQQRAARISLEGELVGIVEDIKASGKWVVIPVEPSRTNSGTIRLKAEIISGADTMMVDRLVLTAHPE